MFFIEPSSVGVLYKYPSLQWSSIMVDLPELENCKAATAKVDCGTDGKSNTAKIVNYGKENDITFAAAEYCYNLTFGGLPQGTWWLPSFFEIQALSKDNYIPIKQIFLNHGINFFDGMSLVWTSTEYDAQDAFEIQLSDGATYTPSYYSRRVERKVSTLCVVGY